MTRERVVEVVVSDNDWGFKSLLDSHLKGFYDKSIDDLSDEELGAIMVHMIGYTDFDSPYIINKKMEEMGFEMKEEEG